jgi:hypothetical protein
MRDIKRKKGITFKVAASKTIATIFKSNIDEKFHCIYEYSDDLGFAHELSDKASIRYLHGEDVLKKVLKLK